MRDPIMIFQAGDLPLWNGSLFYEFHGYQSDFDAKPDKLQGSWNVIFPSNRFAPNPRSVRIDSELVNDEYGSASEKVNRLHELAGFEIDIIGFSFCEDCDELSCCSSCGCNRRGGCPTLLWWVNRGAITRIDVSERDGQSITVQVEIAFASRWIAMNPLLWRWSKERYTTNTDDCSVGTGDGNVPQVEGTVWCDYYNRLPDFCQICERPCGALFSKRIWHDKLVPYITSSWDVMFQDQSICYGYDRYDECKQGHGHSWKTQNKEVIHLDAGKYSAPPSSVYAFTGFQGSGNYPDGIQINVRKEFTPWQRREYVTSIDVDNVATQIFNQGYGNLRITDQIVVGDVLTLPGFVIRRTNNESWFILEGVFVTCSYMDEFPGQLNPGKNWIDIDFEVVTGDERYAMVHRFARL